jgi:hypothetical protein
MKVKHGFSTSSEKGSESESERGRQRERRARGRRGCESLREVGGVRGRYYERERDTHFQTRQPLYIYLYLIKPNFALLKRRENAYTENGEGRGRGKEGSSLTAFLFVMYSSASLMTTFLASADR